MRNPNKLGLILPPNASMLRAIGLVAVQWGYLEYEIDQEIKSLLSHPKHLGREFNFRLPFARRAKEWRSLAQEVYENDHIREVRDISSRAKVIKLKRDTIVHGVYGGESGDLSLATFRAATLVEYGDISLADIKRTAKEISEIGGDMLRHWMSVSRRYAVQPPAPEPELFVSALPRPTRQKPSKCNKRQAPPRSSQA